MRKVGFKPLKVVEFQKNNLILTILLLLAMMEVYFYF